jgi:hypothetical protein
LRLSARFVCFEAILNNFGYKKRHLDVPPIFTPTSKTTSSTLALPLHFKNWYIPHYFFYDITCPNYPKSINLLIYPTMEDQLLDS